MKTVFEVIGMGAKKYGGFEKYIVEEARQLKDKGYKLVVIFDREPLAKAYIDDLVSLGADIEILPYNSKWTFAKGFYKLLKKYQPEIVHTNFSSNLFIALPLALLMGVKTRVMTEHCYPDLDIVRTRIIYQLAVFVVTNILAVSETSAKAVVRGIKFGKSKVNTLYLGVNNIVYDRGEVRSELCIPSSAIALMNVAYHNPVKGVDVLIDAMNIIVNQYGIRDLVLYQIGGGQTGKDTELLHNKVKDLNLNENVRWLGLRNDVPRILFGGDIYVQPSRSEGIGLSIMEASVASLPVVATKVGGIPEVAVDRANAILVPSESPRNLADALIEFYNDSELRKQYGETGQKMAVELFSLERNVSRLIKEYYCIR